MGIMRVVCTKAIWDEGCLHGGNWVRLRGKSWLEPNILTHVINIVLDVIRFILMDLLFILFYLIFAF